MSESSEALNKVTFTGGAYENREGIEVTADTTGITISVWYDAGALLEVEPHITWDQLAALRNEGAK